MAKSKKKTETSPTTPTWKLLAWLLMAAVTALVLVSLVSYDPADPVQAPGAAFGVPNATSHNWAGAVGAMVAHRAYLMLGPGVWVLMAGLVTYLGAKAMGKPITQWPLRAAGLAIMAVAASCLIGLTAPAVVAGYQPGPAGAGGLTAMFINDQLTARFAVPGSMLILIVAFWIGALLTADQLVLALPRALTGLMLKATHLHVPRPQLAGLGLPWRKREAEKPARKPPIRGRRKREELEIDEDAGGFGGTESFGVDDDGAEDEDEEEWEYEYEEVDEADDGDEDEEEYDDEEEADEEAEDADADAPGAYVSSKRKFDPDELRAKMAQLPINFAPKQENAATEMPREVDLSGYKFPEITLLGEPEGDFTEEMESLVRDQAVQLESALRQYKIEGEVVGIDSGPTITLFEVRLSPGTKVSRLHAVDSDLARALKAQNVRIVSNIAGKDTVGVEVPNLKKEMVRIRELMLGNPDHVKKMKLPMFLGKDASGSPLVQDLASMPHMLIAGTTGSGKSVCMNSIIMSFLYTKRPDELKLVLVDPKMVEMSLFRDIPHLMCPVVTEMSKAAAILEWAVTKMDERYELLAEVGVRDMATYNGLGWDEIKERLELETDEEAARVPKKLPYLVFVIDELADLMMTNKEVEGSIVRIAQKARAVGIHLILATQRPQANVVTGLIKSNMPCRVCMKVASGMDSRIVLDQKGGELLLGHGDMLFLSPRSSKLTRAQGCFVDDLEIRKTVKFLKTIAKQSFEPSLIQLRGDNEMEDDPFNREPEFEDAVEVVLERQKGSVSMIQRQLRIGYSKASRIMDQMAAAGIVEPTGKAGQERKVLIGYDEWEAMKEQAARDAAGQSGEPDDEEGYEEEYEDEEDDGSVPDEMDGEYRE